MITLAIVMLSVSLTAQDRASDRPPVSERLFFGGAFGLQVGTVTNIEVSPVIGLWVLPRVAIAGGPTYQYYKDPYGKTSIYGGDVYTQLTLIQDFNNVIPIGMHLGIFAQLEYEGLFLEKALFSGSPEDEGRVYSGTFLAGGGISQPLGKRAVMNLTFLWTLGNPKYSIYSSPEIRMSFNF